VILSIQSRTCYRCRHTYMLWVDRIDLTELDHFNHDFNMHEIYCGLSEQIDGVEKAYFEKKGLEN
jgi:hypothetical protein